MICAACGTNTYSNDLCPFHVSGDSDWAKANRIMCDLFHRGVEPRRLEETERFDTNILSTPAEVNVATYAEGYE